MDTKQSVQLIFAYPYFLILFLEHENSFFSDVNLPRLKTLNFAETTFRLFISKNKHDHILPHLC